MIYTHIDAKLIKCDHYCSCWNTHFEMGTDMLIVHFKLMSTFPSLGSNVARIRAPTKLNIFPCLSILGSNARTWGPLLMDAILCDEDPYYQPSVY